MAFATTAQFVCWVCDVSFDAERKYLRHLTTRGHVNMEKVCFLVDKEEFDCPNGTANELAGPPASLDVPEDEQMHSDSLSVIDSSQCMEIFEGILNSGLQLNAFHCTA